MQNVTQLDNSSQQLPATDSTVVETTEQQLNQKLTYEQGEGRSVKKRFLLISVIVIIIVAIVAGAFYWLSNSQSVSDVSRDNVLRRAEEIDPYIPPGYQLEHKAKMVELESSGTLFDTKLSNGESSIGIIVKSATGFDCPYDLRQFNEKSVCVFDTPSFKSLIWIEAGMWHEVLSADPNLDINELEQIVMSI